MFYSKLLYLKGKDAKKFIEEMKKAENEKIFLEEKERIEKNYNLLINNSKGIR